MEVEVIWRTRASDALPSGGVHHFVPHSTPGGLFHCHSNSCFIGKLVKAVNPSGTKPNLFLVGSRV